MQADYHIHCEYSDDSVYPMEQVVQDAIALGLDEICFTDHVDYGIKKDWDEGNIQKIGSTLLANVDYPRYFAQIDALQKKYAGRITLKKGLEFGVQKETVSRYENLFSRWPLDFVILSVHQIGNQEFWNQDYQKGRTQKEIQEGYYQELLRVVRTYKNYSVLGHLDLINRYDPYGDYPFENVRDLVREILETVIADGKGIEFNTSWHRYRLNEPTPSYEILSLYRQLGGIIITIGSDSHKKEHLGAYLEEARSILRNLGYTQYCTFENMQPVFHPL